MDYESNKKYVEERLDSIKPYFENTKHIYPLIFDCIFSAAGIPPFAAITVASLDTYYKLTEKNSAAEKTEELLNSIYNKTLNVTDPELQNYIQKIHETLTQGLRKIDSSLGELNDNIQTGNEYQCEMTETLKEILNDLKKHGMIHITEKIDSSLAQSYDISKLKESYYSAITSGGEWLPIIKDLDIKRSQLDNVKDLIRSGNCVIITGNSGDGKTEFIKRLSYDMKDEMDIYVQNTHSLNLDNAIYELKKLTSDKRILLCIDNASSINNLWEAIDQIPSNFSVIMAEQKITWDNYLDNLNRSLPHNLKEIKLEITKIDIENCFLKVIPKRLSHICGRLANGLYESGVKGSISPWILIVTGINSLKLSRDMRNVSSRNIKAKIINNINNYFKKSKNSGKFSLILPIMILKLYDIDYSKNIFYEIYGHNYQQLNELMDHGHIKIDCDKITTYHPAILLPFLKDNLGNDLFYEIKKHLDNYLNKIFSKGEKLRYQDVLYPIGSNCIHNTNRLKTGFIDQIKYGIKILKKIPEYQLDNKVLKLISEAYYKLMDYINTEKYLNDILKNNPNDYYAKYNLINLYLEKGEINKLIQSFDEIKKYPDIYKHYPVIMDLYIGKIPAVELIQYLELLYEKDPKNMNVAAALSNMYSFILNEEMTDYYLSKITIEKLKPSAISNAVSSYCQMGNYEKIDEVLKNLEKNNSKNINLCRGSYYLYKGEYREYISIINNFLTDYEHDIGFNLLNVSILYPLMDKSAIKSLDRLKKFYGLNEVLKMEYMKYYSNFGNYTEALRFFEDIITDSPDNIDAYSEVCWMYIDMGNYQKALEVSKRVYEKFPKIPEVIINHAKINAINGNILESKKCLDEYILKYGIDSLSISEITPVYYELKDYDNTLKYGLKLVDTQNDSEVLICVSDSYYEKKKYKEALELVKKLLNSIPLHIEGNLVCGKIYHKLGDIPESKKYLKKCKELCDEFNKPRIKAKLTEYVEKYPLVNVYNSSIIS
ncbi:tetratricopeptide repeat protein [Methanococcus maripaludis]|nr:tetratricopeptide repeat protein [Methanococcus maripaludis]